MTFRIRHLGALFVLALLAMNLVGCGGGGIEEGVPKDAPVATPPEVDAMKNDMMGKTKAD